MVSYQEFEESIELICSQIGKPPAEGRAYERWLENKFELVRHLPATRWAEMVPVAFNSWRFWNEFTVGWVQECSAELYRLEESRKKPPELPAVSPCPAWLGIWLRQCAEARAEGREEPTPAAVRAEMLDRTLDPLEPRQTLNQLILGSLSGALAIKPVSQGLTREETRAAKREVEELWA
jgi:hypothetical protein